MKAICIEDDPTSTVVIQQMLSSAGIDVEGATDAREGLAMMDRDRFDVVIMDLRMPGMNGLTAIRQLRSREAVGKRVPVVVVSAELTPGTRALCQSAGADAFCEKPISMKELFRVVGAAMASVEGCLIR